jgi:hypothetical protein
MRLDRLSQDLFGQEINTALHASGSQLHGNRLREEKWNVEVFEILHPPLPYVTNIF